MIDESLIYRIPAATWSLKLPGSAIKQLMSHAQRRLWSKESVGQLYSEDLAAGVVCVDAITKLRSRWSSYTGVKLDIAAVTDERAQFFTKGLHCLGFWHSHPEPFPAPSQEDIAMAADHARAGQQIFAGIVFIIVGTAAPPDGIGVWVHDGKKLWRAFAQPPSHSRT